MKQLIILCLTLSLLQAISLEEIVTNALEKNPSLDAINERILASKQATNRSTLFENPEVLILTNTIDSDEAMSQNSITLKQKLPYFGKRDSLKNVSLAQESLLMQNLEAAKVGLVYNIKRQAYQTWKLEELYKIVCDYEDLTRQNIELYESYTSTSDNQHMGIMSAQLTLSELRVRQSLLLSQISASYAQLSYLSAQEISTLSLDLEINVIQESSELKKGLENSSELALRKKEVELKQAQVRNADLDNYPDIALVAGFAQRENFDNYASFGLGLSLPIYGAEDSSLEEARRRTLSAKASREDTRAWVNSQYKVAYVQMSAAYEAYHIINDESLPQLEHMFELINASIATGGDLFRYTDILIKKLDLEEKTIDSIERYHKAKAKIEALKGETK